MYVVIFSYLLFYCFVHKGPSKMAMVMDARWFETYRGLNNSGRNILKLITQHVAIEKNCEYFGPHSNKNG